MDKLILELKPLLVSLGEKLGQGGEFVWETLLRQQFIDGFICLFWGIVGIVLLIVGIKCFEWVRRELKKNKYTDVIFNLFWIVPLIVFAFFFGGYNLERSLVKFANPNYAALENVLELVNPNK